MRDLDLVFNSRSGRFSVITPSTVTHDYIHLCKRQSLLYLPWSPWWCDTYSIISQTTSDKQLSMIISILCCTAQGGQGKTVTYRYLKKSSLLMFVMCWLLALPFPVAFLQWPLTILTREMRQAVHTINQSIFLQMSMMSCIAVVNSFSNKLHQRKQFSSASRELLQKGKPQYS